MVDPGLIVNINDFVPSKVSLTKLTQNKSGKGRSAFLNYEGKKFSIAIHDTRFPFGVSQKMKDEKQPAATRDQWTIQIEPNSDQIKIFEALDEYILQNINSNPDFRRALLGAADDDNPAVSIKVLKSRYTSLVKYAKDKETKKVTTDFPAKIRCNIPNKDEGFSTQFFRPIPGSGSSEPVMVDNIPDSDANIANLLRSSSTGSVLLALSLWESGSGFGITMKALQIKAEPRTGSVPTGTCLLDSMMGSSTAQVQDPVNLDQNSEDDVNDQLEDEVLEEEDEEEDEEVSAPPPVVTAKPKVSTKRVSTKVA